MTTLAYTRGILAADTRCTTHGYVFATVTKIRKIDGHLIGAAGNIDLMDWFLRKFNPEILTGKVILANPPASVNSNADSFEGIVIAPTRRIYTVSERFIPTIIKTPGYIAIGSGEQYATGAMAAGADAIAAIKIASVYDIATGGRIQSVKLRS